MFTTKNSMKHKNLLVICHTYNNFQKDVTDSLAPYVSSINVVVRKNPIVELGKIISVPQLERNSSIYYTTDYTNTPQNTYIHQSRVWYIPTNTGYKRLGDKHYFSVRSLVQRQGIKFDLIHSHFTWSAGYVGARLKEKYDVPFVVTAHGSDIYSLPFKDEEWREKIKYVLNTADHIITVSWRNLACIQKLDVSTPVTVIPNGFRSDLFYPRDTFKCRKMLNLPQNKKIILTVGSLEPVKGQIYLVEAVQRLVQERKDILCVIVGAGELRTTLARQIHTLGLENYVTLAGGKPHDEIPLWMNACDLFALPSLNEGNPTVVFEALGCGKPFVGTRVGGVPEVITSDKYGLLVEPADPETLAEKILIALDKKWDREKILTYAKQFTWENIAKEIMKVYEQVLG